MSKNNPPLCVLCFQELEGDYYIRKPGKPVMYTAAWICNTRECLRYGLLSLLRMKGTGEDHE